MGSAAQKESAMDEIQWRNPAFIMQNGPLHTNTVLHYFATSPFFDPTSNNNVIQNQAQYNANLFHVLATREAFETRLRSMQGLEYIVAEQPAETGPGQGTGVWVIRKQNRRKRPGQEDELTVHKDYFLVGENLYAAPTFADLMSSRMVGHRFSGFLQNIDADVSYFVGHHFHSSGEDSGDCQQYTEMDACEGPCLRQSSSSTGFDLRAKGSDAHARRPRWQTRPTTRKDLDQGGRARAPGRGILPHPLEVRR